MHVHSFCQVGWDITVVSQVSARGRLNITCNFGPHGHLPGIKIPYVCIEAATGPLKCGTWGVGTCPGHYDSCDLIMVLQGFPLGFVEDKFGFITKLWLLSLNDLCLCRST